MKKQVKQKTLRAGDLRQLSGSALAHVVGGVMSAEGGGATSDVVNEKIGPDHIVHR